MLQYSPVMRRADVLTCYSEWADPVVIISDGATGEKTFDGDPDNTNELLDWYEPHIAVWTQRALPGTSLWLWNTHAGWATVHTLMAEYGWTLQGVNVWDKGAPYAIGKNRTSAFPSVTEVCAHYVIDPSKVKFQGGPTDSNVWREAPPSRAERIRAVPGQKPIRLMDLIIEASSAPGDVVWEPFGGACTAALRAYVLGRLSFCAESDPHLFALACDRINDCIQKNQAESDHAALLDELLDQG